MDSNTLADTEEQNTYPLCITSANNWEPFSSDSEEIEAISFMLPILEGITYELIGSDIQEYINPDDEFRESVFFNAAYYYPGSLIPCIRQTGYEAQIIPLRIMKEIENACFMGVNDYTYTWPEGYIIEYNEENETYYVGGGDPGTIEPNLESYVINDDGTMDVIMIQVEVPDDILCGRYLFHLVPNEYSKTISDPIFPYCVAEITELER
jgi:hypothetical protein